MWTVAATMNWCFASCVCIGADCVWLSGVGASNLPPWVGVASSLVSDNRAELSAPVDGQLGSIVKSHWANWTTTWLPINEINKD